MIIIYVTYPDMRTARKIVNYLLSKKLIACATFTTMHSACAWKGKMKETKEVITFLKTKSSAWSRVKKDIDTLHPYDIPCIIKWNADAATPYEHWVEDEVSFRART